MFLSCLPTLRIILLSYLLIFLMAGCGHKGSTVSDGSGSMTFRLVWGAGKTLPKEKTEKAATGITTIRIIVSGPDMADIQKEFPAVAGSGVIDEIPVGIGRTVKAQGLGVDGLVKYQGEASNVTIQLDQVTSIGIISMQPYTVNWSRIDLGNIDRISFIGDSYTSSHYTIRDKAYISKLSLFSDYNFENFAVSGETYPLNLKRIRNHTGTYHKSLSWVDYNTRFAMLVSYTNDLKYVDLPQYLADLKEIAQEVKMLGAEPIICTEFHDSFHVGIEAALQGVATEIGARFLNILSNARNFNTTKHDEFWVGFHPGMRTNELFSAPMEQYLRRLPRPRQTLKIFRKRNAAVVSGVEDLGFQDNEQRAKLFKEISIGHHALKKSTESNYDFLHSKDSSSEKVMSEYLKLQNKEAVSFEDYALVDVVLPATAATVDALRLNLSDPHINVYIRDYSAKEWVRVPGDGWGGYLIDAENAAGKIAFDKVTFLLQKEGAFTLNNVSVEWTGIRVDKEEQASPFEPPIAQGAELLAQTLCGTSLQLSDWVITDSIAAPPPEDGVLPYGTNGLVEVTKNNHILQQLRPDTSTLGGKKIQIRVWARYFPSIFDPALNSYPTQAPITRDSYDYSTLRLELSEATEKVILNGRVGLHWQEVVFDVTVPPGANTPTIKVLSADLPIQIAKVSARLM